MPSPENPSKKRPARFPLWLHSTGQWAKKFRGRYYYFGTDKDAALKRYAAEWDGIKNGLPRSRPEPVSADALTVGGLVNAFLTDRRSRVDAGELTPGSWRNYYQVCRLTVATLGKSTPAATLQPIDFGRLRAAFAETRGPNTLGLWLSLARAIFAFGADLSGVAPRYGDQFDGPSARQKRIHRHERGALALEVEQIRKVIAAADPTARAMILLGLNCGYGNTDVARLRDGDVAKEPGWLSVPRYKTGEQRRCPLWPETVAALEAAWKVRPKPADPADADIVFLSPNGRPTVYETRGAGGKPGVRVDIVKWLWECACKKAGVPAKRGVGFYSLRRSFRTVAGGHLDERAIDLIMGHTRDDMGAVYTQRIEDGRLRAVVEHVCGWLFPAKPAAKKKPGGNGRAGKSKRS